MTSSCRTGMAGRSLSTSARKETCPPDARNILTAPTDNWTLAFRVYFPSESVQNNEYKLPEPQLVN